jgi:hypothetical protein
MCTRVVVVDVLSAPAAWDPDDVTILVRHGADAEAVHREVCAILADLDSPVPTDSGVPLCWCGDAVPLPAWVAEGSRRRGTHSRQHAWQVSRGA